MRAAASATLALVAGILVAGLAVAGSVQPSDLTLGTSFTYRGQLEQGDLPANGTFDLEFGLFDEPNGGVVLGTAVRFDQPVADGSFTVQLDYGRHIFAAEVYWLEIRVRESGQGSFTALSPRQRVLSRSEPCHVNGDLHVDGNVGIGTDSPQEKLDVRGNISTGVDGSGGLLHLAATHNSLEGGEISWHGAADYNGWVQDVYQNKMRFLCYSDFTQKVVINSAGGGRADLVVGGNVGIGRWAPTARLEVDGTIHSTTGGFKFPDGSTQDSAAGSSIVKYQCDFLVAPNTSSGDSSCNCPDGHVILGGGWDSVRNEAPSVHDRDVHAYFNRPYTNGWEVGVRNDSGHFHWLMVFAICGDFSP